MSCGSRRGLTLRDHDRPTRDIGKVRVAEWEKQIGAINLIVADLERSREFYRDIFGLPLQHEDEDTAMFRFTDTYVFLQRGAGQQVAFRAFERVDGRIILADALRILVNSAA